MVVISLKITCYRCPEACPWRHAPPGQQDMVKVGNTLIQPPICLTAILHTTLCKSKSGEKEYVSFLVSISEFAFYCKDILSTPLQQHCMSTMACHITSNSTVHSPVCSGWQYRSSASLVIGRFPSLSTSNKESISLSSHHHDMIPLSIHLASYKVFSCNFENPKE